MGVEPENKLTYSPYDPVQLGEYINHTLQKEGRRNFVTFLIGAGCSKSAGIPMAGEIVHELREEAKVHPLLKNVGSPPAGVSEYAFLMEKLGSPRERAQRVKKYVDRANDANGRLRINWTHLLLATMVEKGCINRILTTNFDPLIVEALAVTGQPIRTYDLNTTGKYNPGTLDHASVIYLHGQMHSLFLANAPGEMERLKGLYPSVLQEAVQNSLLIVLGYSGDCDPVLDSLVSLPNFPCGLWWSHYSPSGGSPGVGFYRIASKHGADCHLALGSDSDTFMRKLVVDGMKLDLPDEVMKPFTAARINLERITAFPTQDAKEPDPVRSAIELLRQAEQQSAVSPGTADAIIEALTRKPREPGARPKQRMEDLFFVVRINMAVLTQKWEEFDRLVATVVPDPELQLSRVIGDGFVQRAGNSVEQGRFDEALKHLASAKKFGLNNDTMAWLLLVTGAAWSGQAGLKGNGPEANRLFAEAGQKYAEAVRIKPDMHEAFNTWGNTLLAQAKLKGNAPEADRLFGEAAEKYVEALRLKPDKHEAFYNWATSLLEQGKLKDNTPAAERLIVEAGQKLAEVVRIKPDMHEAFTNWSAALWAQAKLKGKTPAADRLFAEAAQKCAEAVRIKPDSHEAFTNWGNALLEQAKLKGNTPEADQLFAEAGQKFGEALRLKADKHEAFSNWGAALSEQAKVKGNTPEADRLFTEAHQKYAEAMRLKPGNYQALNNWGTALLEQAKLKGNTPEADRLFTEAHQKYAEAMRLKPDFESVHFNIACLAALLGQVRECVEALANWKKFTHQPRRAKLDDESDFDRVRNAPEFQAFRESLPE